MSLEWNGFEVPFHPNQSGIITVGLKKVLALEPGLKGKDLEVVGFLHACSYSDGSSSADIVQLSGVG